MNIHKSDRTPPPPLVTLEVHLFEIKNWDGLFLCPCFVCVWRKKEGDTAKK